ncbi:hypothetical protein HK405_013673, partial [Cladochytrium tenue]
KIDTSLVLPFQQPAGLSGVTVLLQQPGESPIAELVAKLRSELFIAEEQLALASMPGPVDPPESERWRLVQEQLDELWLHNKKQEGAIQRLEETVQRQEGTIQRLEGIIQRQEGAIQQLQTENQELRSSSDRVHRRALLDLARTKLYTILEGDVNLSSLSRHNLSRIQRANNGEPVPQSAILLVAEPGRLRREGNAAAHPDDAKDIRAAIESSDTPRREDLMVLYNFVFRRRDDLQQ